ncbi:MAG: hypothetical protein HOC28_04250 [Bacteroidetes Order II. Incertae sedis bacterium]|nr:hypothetical protein [Bacteroidetes Order II. bacterium]MBT4053373.1 hypothetical protein [Bacteroidetes Order II. bacterium]MBT4602324.1 hypothetical protein [Bacteroidetes Order II. bacterium]MBT5250025.1 hypothetical protein [Bacteroidetes Order II. bacterium]MBT6200561.1 hypothetical protein [Bacteroidetes Order II. bacterium]
MNQDIQQIADQDPIMAQLFELKATFLYKDWQLFRARDAKGLALRIRSRLKIASWVAGISSAVFFITFAFETFSKFGSEDPGPAIFRAAMSLFFLISTWYGHRE